MPTHAEKRLLPYAPEQLFDLVADVSESSDVAAEHPAVVAELMAELRAYEAGLMEPLWP
mgnify:CR=1 FL=1